MLDSRHFLRGDESTRETYFNPLHSCQRLMFLYYTANTYIKDQDIPDNVIVFGQSPNLIFKENKYNG